MIYETKDGIPLVYGSRLHKVIPFLQPIRG